MFRYSSRHISKLTSAQRWKQNKIINSKINKNIVYSPKALIQRLDRVEHIEQVQNLLDRRKEFLFQQKKVK